MGYSLLSFSLGFLLLFHCSFGQREKVVNSQQPQQQQRFQTQCQSQNLNALEPQRRVESEAGVTELWDQNEEQLQCANVAVLRHTLQSRGLLVPSYNNAPELVYVVQGRGIHGAVYPGCPETFQEESQSQSRSRRFSRSERSEQSGERHQKVRHIREGDVIALPAGVAHWIYNNGQSKLVLVALVDVGNSENQLDQYLRKFFLGGSPQQEIQGGGESQSSRKGQQEQQSDNMLSAFDEEILAQSFNIDTELARKLQRERRQRGIIIRVEDLELLTPQRQDQEQEYGEEREQRQRNGLEETFCTMKLKQNINDPSRADVYNPYGGRVTSINALNLPILRYLQLSAEKGVLYRNAILAPHWNLNAHSVIYVIRGNGRIQIVSDNGESVFDEEIREGQLVVVPQNYAVVKRASSEGLEWVSFKTNELAQISQLAGRFSVLRGLPLDVIANSFDISREDARRLKENRQETTVFSPGSRSQRESKSERERQRQ
ncbi:legumin B-like [Mangifera indica]|uniref:legumin B-like n=1 Tax=Mangifera indica TaxID=29780 RepID=UPI001CFB19F7|nr:legumin B-like [Mangifera indica]